MSFSDTYRKHSVLLFFPTFPHLLVAWRFLLYNCLKSYLPTLLPQILVWVFSFQDSFHVSSFCVNKSLKTRGNALESGARRRVEKKGKKKKSWAREVYPLCSECWGARACMCGSEEGRPGGRKRFRSGTQSMNKSFPHHVHIHDQYPYYMNVFIVRWTWWKFWLILGIVIRNCILVDDPH